LVTWIVMVFLIILSLLATRNMNLVPKGLQNTMEAVIEALLKLFDSVTGDRDLTKRIFPLVATIFITILAINWSGLFPGVGTIGLREVGPEGTHLIPFLRASTADLNFTLA